MTADGTSVLDKFKSHLSLKVPPLVVMSLSKLSGGDINFPNEDIENGGGLLKNFAT